MRFAQTDNGALEAPLFCQVPSVHAAELCFSFTLDTRDVALNHGQPKRGQSDKFAPQPNQTRAIARGDVEQGANTERCDQQTFVGQHHLAVGQGVAFLKILRLIGRRHQPNTATADIDEPQFDMEHAIVVAPDHDIELDRVGDRGG